MSVEPPLLDEAFDVPLTFVEVETDGGITGYGLTGYLWPHSTTEFINREAAPVVEGEHPVATDRIWN